MDIKISYNKRFVALLNNLKDKHGEAIFELEGIGTQLDLANFSKAFFKNKTTLADTSVDASASVDEMSVIAYNVELPKPFFRLNSLYLLWCQLRKNLTEEEANEIIEMQITGDIYINDLSGINQPYCYNFSTYDIMLEGLPFVKKIKSEPPKHLSSFIGQIIHFSVYASNSTLGAVGLADLLIVTSYYVDKLFKENEDVPKQYLWKQVKQELQSFIYSCNQPFRGGFQSGFYNISIYDDGFLDKMCSEYTFPDGTSPRKELIQEIQLIYLDLINETLRKTQFTFPITTACFSVDNDKNILDDNFLDIIAEKNLEFGFINMYFGKTSTLSSCCRLRSDSGNEYFNQFGAGGSKIGSLGVVTLNLPRIACKSNKIEREFITRLNKVTWASIQINRAKRDILQKRIDNGNLPLYELGFMALKTQYSTTGINGLYEACEIMGFDILEENGQEFVFDILSRINSINDCGNRLYSAPHNLEQTPSENSAIKLASKDNLLGYQDIYELYSNQFLPLQYNVDILDRIYLQGLFDSKMTGGAIAHLNVLERITDKEVLINLIHKASAMGVVYTAINYNLQKCTNEHMSVGRNETCPVCNADITDNFTRVVGFMVNTKNFHKVRRKVDYPNRVFYREVE